MNIHLPLLLKLDFIAIYCLQLRITQALGIDLCEVCNFLGVDSASNLWLQGSLPEPKAPILNCFERKMQIPCMR